MHVRYPANLTWQYRLIRAPFETLICAAFKDFGRIDYPAEIRNVPLPISRIMCTHLMSILAHEEGRATTASFCVLANDDRDDWIEIPDLVGKDSTEDLSIKLTNLSKSLGKTTFRMVEEHGNITLSLASRIMATRCS